MGVLIIAALHCLYPIIGAILGGGSGLLIGTVIGIISAPLLGAFIFTIPDLIGVAIGFFIALAFVRN